MKKSRKAIALAIVCAILIGTFAACGGSAPAPAAEAPSTPAPAPAADAGTDPASAGISGEITVWDIWPVINDTNSRAWFELLPEFEAAHPNITVNLDSTENEAYKTKFAAAQAANAFPDVFFGWGPASSRELASAGMLLELSSFLDADYMSAVQPGSLDNFTFDGKIYGLTMFNWAAALYCNTELFETHGVKIPATYDELLAAIDAFKAVGVVPFALPAKDPWTIAFFQHIMAIRYTGAENVNAMLKGEKSFDDPGIIQSAQALLDLVDAGAFDPNALASDYADATTRYMHGEYPMFYIGDWFVGDLQDPENSMVVDKVVAVNFPAVSGSFDDQILGGATDGFMVNANSANQEAAVEFAKWMTARMPQRCYAIGGVIPTRSNFNMADYSGGLPALSVNIADFAAKATGATLAWDTFLPEVPRDRMLSMLQQLVGKQITAEEFAKNMAAVIEETGYAKY